MDQSSNVSETVYTAVNVQPSGSCWPLRYTVALLLCLALMNMHAQQVAISSTLSCMLNGTHLIHRASAHENHGPDFFEACSRREEEYRAALSRNVTLTDAEMIKFQRKTSSKTTSTDVRWTEPLQQLIIAAFPCGYILTILIAGLSASRSGGRALLGYSHLVMSVCSLLTPAAAKFMHTYAVIVLQFTAGMAAGATYPCIMAIWQRWAPPKERAILFSITYSGMPLGVVLATSTVQVTCYYGQTGGWSALFIILGLLGIIWFIIWMVLVSSRPQTNKWISETEEKLIASNTMFDHELVGVQWKCIFSSRAVWAVIIIHVAIDWTVYLLTYAIPVYLRDVYTMNVYSFLNGYFSTAPFAAFLLVVIVCGYLADLLHDRCRIANIRRIMSFFGANITGACLTALTFFTCRQWIYVITTLTVMTANLGLLFTGAMIAPLDMCPRLSPVLVGISLSISAVVKLAASNIVDYFTAEGGELQWTAILYSSSALLFISSLVFSLFYNEGSSHADLDRSDPSTMVPSDNEMHSFITQRFSASSAVLVGDPRHQSISVDSTPTANVKYIGQSFKDLTVMDNDDLGQSIGSAVNSLTNLRRLHRVVDYDDQDWSVGGGGGGLENKFGENVREEENIRNYPMNSDARSLNAGIGATTEFGTRGSMTKSNENVGSERVQFERLSSVDISSTVGRSRHKVSIV